MLFRPCRDSLRFLPLYWATIFRPPGWAGPLARIFFWILCNIRASTSVYHESAAATGGGRNESRGQGPRGFVSTSEAPILVHRRAAMTSPQRHRDGRDNSQLISGDGPAPTPCPKCHGGEDSCETKPISGCAGWGEAWGTAAVEGDRAKQSQFGPGCPETDAGRQTWGPCRGRLRKTDPILRRGLSCEWGMYLTEVHTIGCAFEVALRLRRESGDHRETVPSARPAGRAEKTACPDDGTSGD